MKGFFSMDAGVAAMLAVILMVLVVQSFHAQASAFAQNAKNAESQLRLLERADFLLKTCDGEGGMAECDSKTLKSHEVRDNGLALLIGPGETVRGKCVKRVVLYAGSEKVMAVCEER